MGKIDIIHASVPQFANNLVVIDLCTWRIHNSHTFALPSLLKSQRTYSPRAKFPASAIFYLSTRSPEGFENRSNSEQFDYPAFCAKYSILRTEAPSPIVTLLYAT